MLFFFFFFNQMCGIFRQVVSIFTVTALIYSFNGIFHIPSEFIFFWFYDYIYFLNVYWIATEKTIHNVFKNGPYKICGRKPLKNLKRYGPLKQTRSLQFFKGCLPHILLGLFLNTLSHFSQSCISFTNV